MRYLTISLCLLFACCGSYPKKQGFQPQPKTKTAINNPYFSNSDLDYVYKANIAVYNQTFGGLLIIKKLGKENHRVVFTTEMGNKLFDFSFIEDTFTVNYVLKALDRKTLLNILKHDFKTLIQENNTIINTFVKNDLTVFESTVYNKTHFYFQSENLNKIVRISKQKEKIVFLFSDINNNIARHIEIIHNSIKLNITLKSIK